MGKAYVGTGYDGDKWLKDFYQYDAEKNNWYKKRNFPVPPAAQQLHLPLMERDMSEPDLTEQTI
jgi:hypothetical protein